MIPTPAQFRPRYGPKICLGRYSQHLSGWTDEHGQNRCRRCHAPLPPKGPRESTDHPPWSKARQFRHEKTEAQREVAKPPAHVHDPRCPHPPVPTDVMTIHKDAQERMGRGEKQLECPICREWIFEGLFHPPVERESVTTDQNTAST